MQRPKILITLFRIPYPVTDGTRYKIFHNLIEGLSPAFDIEFLITTIDPAGADAISYLENRFGPVHIFRRSKIQFFLGALRSLFSRMPLQVSGWTDTAAKKWVRKHIDSYDAVYVHEIRTTEYFIGLSETHRKKCLVDFNDAISYNYQIGSKRMSFPKNIMYRIEGKRIKRYETAVLRSFFHFNVASPKDRALLLQNAGMTLDATDFECIPHGVRIPQEQASLQHGTNLFFMGQLNYAPNRDALAYFISHLWEPLQNAIPNLSLHIIGKGTPPVTHDPAIHFHGFVPDPFTVIADATILVAPIRYGAGIPSKILEAMSYGLPAITTPIGVQGVIGIQPGENILVSKEDDIEGWVSLLKKISIDEPYRKYIGTQARLCIEKHYASAASQRAFKALFDRIL